MTEAAWAEALYSQFEDFSAVTVRPEPMTCAEWADKHFKTNDGDWETMGFQVAILNAMGNDDIQQVVLKKSARVGYSQMLLANTWYKLAHRSRDIIIYQPTDSEAGNFSKDELDTSIMLVEEVRKYFPYAGKKSPKNAQDYKEFKKGKLHILGGNSPNSFARRTVQEVSLDELERFDADIRGEGSASMLAWKRTEGQAFRKMIRGSTPTIKDQSAIEDAESEMQERFVYEVPCPHCDHFQALKFGGKDTRFGLKWDASDPDRLAESVKYMCEHCECLIDNHSLARMDRNGRWLSQSGLQTRDGIYFYRDGESVPAPRTVGFFIWTAYNPRSPWFAIIHDWLKAQASPLLLKGFFNTTLGQTWDLLDGESIESDTLESRVVPYKFPREVCYIVAGCDVQGDRWEVQFHGYTKDRQIHVLDYQVVNGNPEVQSEWEDKLLPVLQKGFAHPSGATLKAQYVGIDTGGSATQQAYKFCYDHDKLGILALKGADGDGRPLIPLRPSKQWKLKGLKGWIVGTHTGKEMTYGLLSKTSGPGFVHFYNNLPGDYFEQLTSERRIPKFNKTTGKKKYIWFLPSGKKNEALDTFVYALAAMEHSSVNLEREHERLQSDKKPRSIAELAAEINGGAHLRIN